MIEPGYAKGGDIVGKLAKLAKLLSSHETEVAAPVARASEETGKAFTPTGRQVPRDDEYERLQSLVTNQPTGGGAYQWNVIKPGGQPHGAPFDFKGSALQVANALNQKLPGHTVQALSVDNPAISRYAMRMPDPNAQAFRKLDQSQIDALLAKGDQELAEGGEVEAFDPIDAARQRVYGSSSPGSPGVSGAIKDAIAALKSYLMGTTQNEVAEDKRQYVDSQVEGRADGGMVEGPSTEHEKAGLGKRFGVRVMEQAYGLDANGHPALGGRAWTQGQGGTPMGLLDEITAVPHNLLSLAHTTRSLDPLRKYFPDSQGLEDKLFESIDPQWSKDASDRLERLRSAMNQRYDVGEAHSLPEHMTDAAASLVSPIPMAKAGSEANLGRRLLEMTTPLRPRTVKGFATDTAVLGGIGTGIDALTDRLSRLRGQTGQGGGAPVDPASFSRDMGLQPEDRSITNSHQMIPMVTEHGDIYYGVDPETL